MADRLVRADVTSPLRRRAVVALAAALVAGVVVADSAAATRVPRCLSFGDPTGEATANSSGAAYEQNLDLSRVRLEVAGGRVVARLTVVRLGEVPEKAWGDRFQVGFTVAKTAVDFYYKRSRTRDVEGAVIYQQGVRVDKVLISDAVAAEYDVNTSTVAISVDLRTLSNAIGKDIYGRTASDVHAVAFGSYLVENVTWDRAATTTSWRITNCR